MSNSLGPHGLQHVLPGWLICWSGSHLLHSAQLSSLSRVRLSQLHGLHHARPPCSSPTTRAYSNSCPMSRWCHPTISCSIVPFSSCLQSFPASESVLHIRWPKYQSFSFSISPSNEYSVLISFRSFDWLDLLAVQRTQESSLTPQFKNIRSLALSFLCNPTLTSIHDYWKNPSFD